MSSFSGLICALLLVAILLLSACAPQQEQAKIECTDEQTAMHTVLKGLIIARGGVFQGGC